VPERWRPHDPPFDRVTVGVSDPERADGVLRAAFEVAQRRGSALRVVHSWWLANGYDAVVVDDDMRRELSQRFRAEVAPHLDGLRADYPDVAVDVLVLHAEPAVGLMHAAEDSDVVVVGRRHWALPVGSHVGAVTRALLRAAACPVVVVETTPVHAAEPSPGAGHLQVPV
jgi:nucleotide-binding universal stress UspA family protein